ncbi:MAG TPA: hypothetical protein VNW92_00275 [Polyangiaceae bacterium]|jgi:hypothetical protein|nr:hypothetical protein [Polyangiaceae bacterium]
MRTTKSSGPKAEFSGWHGLALLALVLVAGAGCSNRERAQQAALPQPAASALPTSSAAPMTPYDYPRVQSSADAAVVAAPAAASTGSAPAPVPSVLMGQAACDACFAAERAGKYLTPQGVSHYLAGCDDDKQRAACLTATKQSLPKRARQLALAGKCEEAHALAEFGERARVSSPGLTAAVASCRPRPTE